MISSQASGSKVWWASASSWAGRCGSGPPTQMTTDARSGVGAGEEAMAVEAGSSAGQRGELGGVGGGVLPDLPHGPPVLVQLLERLAVLEGVHAAPEAVVRVAGQTSLLDEPLERFDHQLLALVEHVPDLVAQHEVAAVHEHPAVG